VAERIYEGFAQRGRQTLPTRTVAFERGVPVEVDADEATVLDAAGDWSAPKPTKPPEPPKPKGSAPEQQES
jgi:hypothetical protein